MIVVQPELLCVHRRQEGFRLGNLHQQLQQLEAHGQRRLPWPLLLILLPLLWLWRGLLALLALTLLLLLLLALLAALVFALAQLLLLLLLVVGLGDGGGDRRRRGLHETVLTPERFELLLHSLTRVNDLRAGVVEELAVEPHQLDIFEQLRCLGILPPTQFGHARSQVHRLLDHFKVVRDPQSLRVHGVVEVGLREVVRHAELERAPGTVSPVPHHRGAHRGTRDGPTTLSGNLPASAG
mmetsp:Transcript_3847/g.13498  ORF Transcript_3847/g.13498 Transcript_3847/m.13498 type:complete len:239 (-) Transcript_3847:9-725(-)